MNLKIYTSKIACLLCTACFAVIAIQAQSVMKVQSGAVIATTGGAVITLSNMSLNNDGTISQSTGQGSFLFNGNANSTISGTSSPLFDILQIAKTGSAKLTLQQDIQIGSGITFTSGIIDLNMQNILLQPTAFLNGESETSYITGTNGGYVQITNTLNAPSLVNAGNLGAIITSTQNLGSTIVRRGHVSQTNVAAGNSQTTLSYTYTDPQSPAGMGYYQLLQRDINGHQTYSPVLMSQCGQPESIKVYPNPVQNTCWVNIQSETSQAINLRVYDSRGALLKQQAVNIQAGNNQFALSLNSFTPGSYSLVVTLSDGKVKAIPLQKN